MVINGWLIYLMMIKGIYHLVITNSSRTGKIHHAIKNGKPSISIRAMAIFHGEPLVITRG